MYSNNSVEAPVAPVREQTPAVVPSVSEPGFDRFMKSALAPIEENKTPDNYAVLLWNDDTTPFQYVVGVLEEAWGIPHSRAYTIMMAANESGKAVVCILPEPEARDKLSKAAAFCVGFELKFTIEKE